MVGWPEAVTMPRLERDQVHVWLARSRVDADGMRRLEAYLSRDERRRADGFALERPRHAFIAVRGVLRVLVGAYLNQPPRAIALSYRPTGKPILRGSGLEFNLSHSEDLALVAVAWGRRLGVDLERIRHPAPLDVATRFFSPREQQVMGAIPPSGRPAAFFTCWVRREAYLKAIGEGLAVSPDSFSVSARPDCLAGLRGAADAEAVGRWPPGRLTARYVDERRAAVRKLEARPLSSGRAMVVR